MTSRGEHARRSFIYFTTETLTKHSFFQAILRVLYFFLISSTELSSDTSSFVSENEYLSEYEEMSEIEADDSSQIETSHVTNSGTTSIVDSAVSSDEDAYAWVDDRVADEEWTAEYEEDIRQNEILEEKMLKRLNGTTELSEW